MKKTLQCCAGLLLILSLTVFGACDTIHAPSEGAQSDPTPLPPDENGLEQEGTTVVPDLANAYVLADRRTTQYVIVVDDDATEGVESTVLAFCEGFRDKTGADLQVVDDTVRPIAKEIIVSTMDGRDEPSMELAKLSAPEQKGYRVSTVGEKIIVAAEEELLADALALLTRAISDYGDGKWGIPKNYIGRLDIPKIEGSGELYDVGEGNYAYNVSNANDTTFRDLNTDLVRDGFSLYTENTIGESQFKTYVKDSIYGSMVVYLMYHPAIRTLRLTYGAMEYLPYATPIAAADRSDPTITQMYLEMVNYGYVFGVNQVIHRNDGAPGMSYLLQLTDGRFIVIDGGSADGTVYTAKYDETTGKWMASDHSAKTSDTKRLYDTMCQMKPDSHERPQIAVWFISHAHGDHLNLAKDFLGTYKGAVELELVAFNFPNPANAVSRQAAINEFRAKAEQNFGAKVWIMHTGQQLFLPGCEIEVMSTVEDFYCTGMVGANETDVELNNTCVVYRVTVGNTDLMVMGDAYPTTSQFMADAYGEALQTDILQLAHHGVNGAVYDLYVAIDPKICLWPIDEYRFCTDSRTIGTETGSYQFNWYLRNKPWTRSDGTSGTRAHYTASYMTTVNANTGKTVKNELVNSKE